MDNEIKIVYADVEAKVSTLKAATEAITATFPQISGENVLDTVDMINEINSSLQSLMSSYKALLLTNEMATSESIEAMKKTDEKIAAQIK